MRKNNITQSNHDIVHHQNLNHINVHDINEKKNLIKRPERQPSLIQILTYPTLFIQENKKIYSTCSYTFKT